MSKANDVEDLLGETTAKPKAKAKAAPAKEAAPAVKKTAAKKEAAAEPAAKAKAPAKKAAAEAPAAKAPKAKKEAAEPKERVAKEPVRFEEGERDELIKKIKANCKKPINSRDLAAKLGVETRKLRPALYSAQKRGIVDLEPGASPVAGMTVSLAAAA